MKDFLKYLFLTVFLMTALYFFADAARSNVSDGEKADANTFNQSFVSREINTDTIGIFSLLNTNPASGDTIPNVQAAIHSSSKTSFVTESITAGGTISVGDKNLFERRSVVGTPGAVIAAGVLFGTGPFLEGKQIRLYGDNAINTVTIIRDVSTDGVKLKGSKVVLSLGDYLDLEYNLVDRIWVEVNRSLETESSVYVLRADDDIQIDPATKVSISKPLVIQTNNHLTLQDLTGGEGVSLKSPNPLTGSYTLTLPPNDGNANQKMISDGAGILDWKDTFVASNDNRLMKSDTVGDAETQESGITVDDSDSMTGVNNLAVTTLQGVAIANYATTTNSIELSNKKLTGGVASTQRQWVPPADTTANLTTLCTSLTSGSLVYSTDETKYFLCDGTSLTAIGSGGGGGSAVGFTASEIYAALSTPAAATNVNLADVVLDTEGAWSAVNDEYTINETGQYLITAGATFTNMRQVYFYYVSLYKNGVEVNGYWRVNNRFKPAAVAGVQAAGFNGVPTGILSLTVGDKISVRVNGKSIDVSETGTIRHILSITKVGSPLIEGGISEEIIGAKASMNHAQTLATSTLQKIQFDTEENDTHSNYDPTTNYRYTVGAGQAGYYDINYNISLIAGTGVLWANCQVLINGSGTEITSTERADPIDTQWYPYVGHATENLAVGDYVEIWCRSQAGTSDTLNTGSIGATFSVYKKPNAGVGTNAVAIANSTVGQAVAAAGNIFIAGTEVKDTHNLYNPSTGEFTCDRNGTLTVSGNVRTQTVLYQATELLSMNLLKNAVVVSRMALMYGNQSLEEWMIGGSVSIDCAVNDVISVELSSTVNSNLSTNAYENRMSFILE